MSYGNGLFLTLASLALLLVIAAGCAPKKTDPAPAAAASPNPAPTIAQPPPQPLAQPASVQLSDLYAVSVNGQPVPVYHCLTTRITDEQGELMPDRHQTDQRMSGAFCLVELGRPAVIDVTVRGPALHFPLKSAIIRPLKHGIKPQIVGEKTLRFEVPGPCKLSVEPNGAIRAPLMLFCSRPEPREIKPTAPKAGLVERGLIYLPPGEHDIGVLKLESNTTLYLAPGAIAYGRVEASNAANVRILGRGILSGSRLLVDAGRGIRLFKCRDVLIDGPTILDAASWGIEVNFCDHVRIHDVNILSGRGSGDGIDVCSSEEVSVDNAFLRTHDDTLNVKGLTDLGYAKGADGNWSSEGVRKAARNIRFTRCVVWNDRAHALMIGPETRASQISDVLWKEIDIIHALSVHAIAIFSGDNAEIRNVRYEDITVEDARVMEFIGIRVGPTYVTADPKRGPVRDIVYRNVRSLTPGAHSVLASDDLNGPIERITFDNLRFGEQKIADEKAMLLHTRGTVRDVTWR